MRRSFAVTGAVIGCLLAPTAAAAQGELTTNVVSCTPQAILVGAATSCSATVQDASPDGTTPSGSIDFSSDTPGGAFKDPEHPANSMTTCSLLSVGEEHAASCRLLYVPGTFGTGVHEISATYAGDDNHDGSSNVTQVDVSKHSSATSISCTPESIILGSGPSTCVVTVTDTSTVPSAPTGRVALTSAAGSFGPGCEILSSAGTSQAKCAVAYTPAAPGSSSLTAAYGGDSSHEPSGGTGPVNVAAPPGAPVARKKCKKNKKKHSASAAKKKCKKKKRR